MRIKHLRRSRRAAVAILCSILIVFASLHSERVTGQQRRAPQRSVASSSAQPSAQRQAGARPRLVLLIVVDQFRYDYLERFGNLFSANGLGRLMRDGASWTEANYDHIPTYTAPGHSTLMTGAWPAETGIIANEWPTHESSKTATSVEDEKTKLLGGAENEKGASPHRLMASTLGDELRLATDGRSKVIGISEKDRAAILPAGRHANAAYWFGWQKGSMVSSTYYFPQLPAWVTHFNEQHLADQFFRKEWTRLLPEAEYLKYAGPDSPPWETVERNPNTDQPKDSVTFPHIVTGGANAIGRDYYEFGLSYTPFSNELLLAFTEQAIVNENLGADEDTDLLTLSFSANDHVGHRFGPYSQEMMDITLRTDRQIGALLDFVNKRIGLQNTVVIFTADHGVAPIPEHAVDEKLPGGRIPRADVLSVVKAAIAARYQRKGESKDTTADYVTTYYNNNIYFNTTALRRDGINEEEIERVAGDAAMTVPRVRCYFTRTQLQQGAISPADPLARRALHGFYPSRSGDVVLIYDAFNNFSNSITTPADHGSPYSYDTHVPLIIMGGGAKSGRYIEAAAPSDIAPTLAAMLRIQKPSNAVGRILTEGLTNTKAQR
ncbi:MAG: alkaline phosphatase family protein [Pyrinomonadaceae bacterium]